MKYFNLTVRKYLNEKPVKIPVLGELGYSNVIKEEHWMGNLLKRLSSLLTEDRTFIDVGVNVGQTLLLAKSRLPGIRYVGFEANIACIHYVNRLVAVNGFKDCLVIPVGLSDKTQLAKLYFFNTGDQTDEAATVERNFRPKPTSETNVVVFSADELGDLFTSYPPGLIKIDVEGSELEVIKGMKNIVETYRPGIICEILPANTFTNTFRISRQNQVIDILMELQYKIYRVLPDGQMNPLEKIEVHSDITLSNYVFLPVERIALIKP